MFLEYEFRAQAEYVIQPHITASPVSQTCKSVHDFHLYIIYFLIPSFFSGKKNPTVWIFVKEQKNSLLNPIKLFNVTDVADV